MHVRKLRPILVTVITPIVTSCGDGGIFSLDASGNGAIAVHLINRSAVIATDYPSQAEANSAVLLKCGAPCEVVLEFGSELCGAYASAANGSAGWAASARKDDAEKEALNFCRSNLGLFCTVKLSGCNS